MHLEKNRTYACTFPVQRKEINVVKVRFTMRYSSRKLSNEKVITTACNFWRQIACSFQVMSRNILFLGNKIFEIPPFFQTRPGDLGKKVHACSLRFYALNLNPALNNSAQEIADTRQTLQRSRWLPVKKLNAVPLYLTFSFIWCSLCALSWTFNAISAGETSDVG